MNKTLKYSASQIDAAIEKIIGLDTSIITNLTNNKYDNVTLSGNTLSFYANGNMKKSINLPSGGSSGGGSGIDGREIELSVQSGYIAWRYKGDSSWTNLVSLESLKGATGATGQAGSNGTNATINGMETLEIVGGTNISIEKNTSNKTITINSTVVGGGSGGNVDLSNYYTKGQVDTKDTEIKESVSAVDAKAIANTSKISEVTTQLETVKTSKVDKVVGKGLSENDFTNALKSKLEGLVNHTTVINDLVSSKYDNVLLNGTSLKFYANNLIKKTIELPTFGESGGTNGKDGREVELSVQNGYIAWRYVGDTNWINLVSVASLKGDTGINGKSIEYIWRGTELGVRQQGQNDYSYVNLKGQTGNTGSQGTKGDYWRPSIDSGGIMSWASSSSISTPDDVDIKAMVKAEVDKIPTVPETYKKICDITLSECKVITVTGLDTTTGIFTTSTNLDEVSLGYSNNLVISPGYELDNVPKELCSTNDSIVVIKVSTNTFKVQRGSTVLESYEANNKLDFKAFTFQGASEIHCTNINLDGNGEYRIKIIGPRGRAGQTYVYIKTNKGIKTISPFDGKPIMYIDVDINLSISNNMITATTRSAYRSNRINNSIGWDMGVTNVPRVIDLIDWETPTTLQSVDAAFPMLNGGRMIIWRID